MNCLQSPKDKNTVNVIAGLSGSSSTYNPLPLNNLNDLWIKNLEKLQSGDIMVCGGDFIQSASPDACFLGKDQKDPTGSLTVTAATAATWKVNADYDHVCSSDSELYSCNHGATGINKQRVGTSQCICPCINCENLTDEKKCKSNMSCDWNGKNCTLSTYASNLDLLTACNSAMQRGVKIVFMDDMFFLSDIYADNKRGHDFTFITLQHYSDTLDVKKNPACKGGGFYWYMYGQQGKSINNGFFLRTHAKVTSFYFIGPSHKNKYFSSIQGSFNPSYPISLTFENAVNVVGLLENEFIKASAYFVFDELTHVISFAYTSDPSLGPRRYYTGLGNSPCPPSSEWASNNTTPNHCNIPPCSSGDRHGFLQPWFMIANALGISGFNPTSGEPGQPPQPAAWWKSLNGTIWASSDANTTGYYPVFGEDVFNKPLTIPTVQFCGLDFTKIKYGKSIGENRVTFTDSNVVVKFGSSPTQLMGRYYFGLSLLSELMGDANEYVKVGLMQNFLDYPCVGDDCGNTNKDSTDIIDKLAGAWMLGPSTQLPTRGNDGKTTYYPGQMLTLFNKGIPIYAFQKDISLDPEDMCAFTCDPSAGKCKVNPPDPSKSFPNQLGNGCFDAYGNITGSGCYSDSYACGKKCTTKEGYTGPIKCNGNDYQDYVTSWTRGYNDSDTSPTPYDMMTPWLQGKNPVLGVQTSQLGKQYTGTNGPQSKLGNGKLSPVSKTNPYPLFTGWYSQNKEKKSGLHWKFYMSEKSILFSTQHPIPVFYSSGDVQNPSKPGNIYNETYTAMGYDIKWGNCPNMIAYYDQLYNWVWENSVWTFDGLFPSTPSAKNLIPPLCSTLGCKLSAGKAVGGDGSCYAGGKGAGEVHTGGYKCTPGTGKWKDNNFCDPDNSPKPQFSSEAECMAASKNGCKPYTGGWKCTSGTGKGEGSYYCDTDSSKNPKFKTYEECIAATKNGCKAVPPSHDGGKFPWGKIAQGVGISIIIIIIGLVIWFSIKSLRGSRVKTKSESMWKNFNAHGGLKYTALALVSLLIIILLVNVITRKHISTKDYLMRIYPAMDKNLKGGDYDKLFDSLGQFLQCCQTNNTYLDASGNLVGDAITGPSGEAPNKMRYIGGIERFGPDSNPQAGDPFYPPIWKGYPCCQGDYKIPRMPRGTFIDWYSLQYFNVPVINVNDKGWDFFGRSKPSKRGRFRSISTLGSTSPGTNLFGTIGMTSKNKQASITPSDPMAVNQGVPYGQVAGPGAVYAGSSFFCKALYSPNGPQFDPDNNVWTMSGQNNVGNNWLHQYVTLDNMKHALDFSNNKPWFNGFKEGEHFEIGHTQRIPGFPNSTGYWANYFGGGGTGQFLRAGKTPVVGADQVADLKKAFPSSVDPSIFKDLAGASPRNKMHLLFTLLWQVKNTKTLQSKAPQGITSGSDLLKYFYNTDDPWLITFWYANCAAPGPAGNGFTDPSMWGKWNSKPQTQDWQDFMDGKRSFTDFALPTYKNAGYAPYMVPLPELATESQGETFVQPNKWGMAPDMYQFYFGSGSQGPTQKVSDRQVGGMFVESISKLGVYNVNTPGNVNLIDDLYGKWSSDAKYNTAGSNYATVCAFLLQAEFGNTPDLKKYVTPPQWYEDDNLQYKFFMNTTAASLDPSTNYLDFLKQFPTKGKPGIGSLTYEGVKYSLAKAFMSNWLFDRAGNGVNWDEPMNYFGQVLNYELLQMPCNTNLTGFWSFEIIHIRNPDTAFQKWNKDLGLTLLDGAMTWKDTITSQRQWPYISNGSAGASDTGTGANYSAPGVVIFNSLLASSLSQRDPFDITNDSKVLKCNSIAGFKCDSIPGVKCLEQSNMVWSKENGTLQSWMTSPDNINYSQGMCSIDLDRWPGYSIGTTDGTTSNVVMDNNGMCHVPWAGPCVSPLSATGVASFACPQFQGGGFEMMGSSFCQNPGDDKPSLPSLWSNTPMGGHVLGDSIVTPLPK